MTATLTRAQFDLLCSECGFDIPAGSQAYTTDDGDAVCVPCHNGQPAKPAEPESPKLELEAPEAPAEPECNGKPKRPKPAGDGGDAGAQVAALIRQIAETAEAQIDPDEVREIAAEAARASLIGAAREAAAVAVRSEIDAIRDAHTVRVHAAEAVRELDGPVHPVVKTLSKVCGSRLRRGFAPNVLLVGPAGCGKTTAAAHAAEALGLPFDHISFSGGLTETRLFGRMEPTGEAGRFEYREPPFVQFYRNGGVYLLDEIDAADENVLISAHTALSNGHMKLPTGETVERHRDFVAVACANTWGNGADRQYCGRNQLDVATLDRYAAARFFVDYDEELERRGSNPELVTWAQSLRRKARENGLRRVISTRFIHDASDLVACEAYTLDDAKRSLLADWSDNDLRTVGEVRP